MFIANVVVAFLLGLYNGVVVALNDQFLSVIEPAELKSIIGGGLGRIDQRRSPDGLDTVGCTIQANAFVLPEANQQGCAPFMFPLRSRWSPMAVLLTSGGCAVSVKVKHAQDASAEAVIIAHDDDQLPPFFDLGGKRDDLLTASTIIKNSDAIKIFSYIKDNPGKPVKLTFYTGMEKRDLVSIRFWTSTLSRERMLLDLLRPVLEPLQTQNKVAVAHHYEFMDGNDFHCVDDAQLCGNQCTNRGRYCAADPNDDPNSRSITGADVVQEYVRRICIHQRTNQANTQFYWEYSERFAESCTAKGKVNQECSKRVSDKIDPTVFPFVEKCAAESGGPVVDFNGNNTLIDAEMELQRADGFWHSSQISINDSPYYGSTKCSFDDGAQTCPILSAICGAFTDSSLPDVCRLSGGCGLGKGRDVCGQCMEFSSPNFVKDIGECGHGGVSFATVVFVIGFFVAVLLGIAFVYQQRAAGAMRHDIRRIMSQYVPLDKNDLPEYDRTPFA
uniref:Vacuolar sorting receptor thioredoxin-like domain-containing protein n=1 Tax=Spongospora subterranea TaxID=70186 RepID=A0A0H5RN92_9EUKA|eukprot:CRZ10209.1 hypothetical protein [Spongospora subterranea]